MAPRRRCAPPRSRSKSPASDPSASAQATAAAAWTTTIAYGGIPGGRRERDAGEGGGTGDRMATRHWRPASA